MVFSLSEIHFGLMNCQNLKFLIVLYPAAEYSILKRDKYIESLVFTVLRFEYRFVFQEPEYLKNEIRKVINKNDETI